MAEIEWTAVNVSSLCRPRFLLPLRAREEVEEEEKEDQRLKERGAAGKGEKVSGRD